MSTSYEERFAAQSAAIGRLGQLRLKDACVHFSGFGGIGNVLACFLAAMGVGSISANDPQSLEADNLSRFLCGGKEAAIGKPKVYAAADHFYSAYPGVRFDGRAVGNESTLVNRYYRNADWVVCASNTAESRLACCRKALRYEKPILDVAVADGRQSFTGTVKYKLPEAAWAACPACYLQPGMEFERGEGLVFSVISATAALAAHVLFQLITGADAAALRAGNLILIGLKPPYCMEVLAVAKRDGCTACGRQRQ